MSQTFPSSSAISSADSDAQFANATSRLLGAIYAPIKDELQDVETILAGVLDRDSDELSELLSHSHISSGKRMRPVFLLLSAGACGEINERHHYLAAALEMIHTATLVHDDVIDEAKTRRHEPTANSKWGSKASVLLGDYLFTHSFHVASLADSAEALRFLAAASNRVCSGEIRQNAWIGKLDLSEEQYLEIISDKTAELCSVACYIGATLSKIGEQQASRFEEFGRSLGIAFQIIDDVLDIVGHPSQVGKTLGTDIANRKMTLPVIHSLSVSETDDRQQLVAVLNGPSPDVAEVIPYLEKTNSVSYARELAVSYGNRALEFVNSLPESEYRNGLRAVTEFVLLRTH